jgi:hypothetical protein
MSEARVCPITGEPHRTSLQATLHTVIQLAATMPDPHAMILGIRAADPSRFGHGGASDGLPFRLDTTIDYWDTETGDVRGIRTKTGIHDWAATWAASWWSWSDDGSPKPSGDMLQWLASRLAWAERCYPAMTEFEDEANLCPASPRTRTRTRPNTYRSNLSLMRRTATASRHVRGSLARIRLRRM